MANFHYTIQAGNYMTDGKGIGFVADRIYEADNPQLSDEEVIDRLKNYLGLSEIIVLESEIMDIEDGGDQTGHIDMFAKLLDENTVLVGEYEDTTDVNYQILENNSKTLEDLGYNVIRIPMLRDPNDYYTIWTYTNSLIINSINKKVVLIPQYNIPEDTEVISIYEQAMPDYEIIAINCNTMIKYYGSIHCVTMTVPEM